MVPVSDLWRGWAVLSVLRSFKGKPVGLLGVDIGSASIKLVELSRQAQGCRVEAYGMEPLPPNAVVDGQFSDVERIGEAIRELKRQCGCRSKRAALALSGPLAVIKTLAVDAALADADVQATIEVEAERHLPAAPDEVAYDFEVQGLSPLDPKQAEAVLAACPKAQLSQGVAVLRAARLQPAVVEIEEMALARGLAEARTALDGDGEGLTALFDVGSGAAKLKVFERGLCIHRATEALDAPVGVPVGMPDAVGNEPAQPDIDSGSLARAAAQALERFAASAAPNRVGAALFAGAGVGSALVDAVDERLPVRTAVANPFQGMSLAPRVDRQALFRDAPSLLTACGLALRSGP